jgi:hypothetical protein
VPNPEGGRDRPVRLWCWPGVRADGQSRASGSGCRAGACGRRPRVGVGGRAARLVDDHSWRGRTGGLYPTAAGQLI